MTGSDCKLFFYLILVTTGEKKVYFPFISSVISLFEDSKYKAYACSSRGDFIASCSPEDQSITIMSTKNFKLVKKIDLYNVPTPTILSFTSTEDRIYGSHLENIYAWSFPYGNLVQVIHASQDMYTILSLACNKRYLVSGSNDWTVKVWSTKDGRLLHNFEENLGTVNKVLLTKDEKYAISGSSDQTVRYYNIENGLLEKTYQGRKGISTISLSQDESLLVAGFFDGTITIWNTKTDQLMYNLMHQGRKKMFCWSASITSLFFDDDTFISSSLDGSVNFWNLEKEHNYVNFQSKFQQFQISKEEVPFLFVCKKFLLSSSLDNTLKLWKRRDLVNNNFYEKVQKGKFIDVEFNFNE